MDISGSQMVVTCVPATRLQNQVLMLVTNHLWRRNREERIFAQRAVWSGDHRITQGKMRQERLLVSLPYQFPGSSTPEDKHTEIVRVTGDAPGT